jgi:hypothetical protein
MNAVVKSLPMDESIIAKLVTGGDLKGLNDSQRVAFYNYRCTQAGLDPAAQPFSLLTLNGKTVLYANASCAQQLCGIHKLSTAITSREKIDDDIYMVTARVASPDGRFSENTGAVPIAGLKGEALSNAILKATTKAIRRTVLAHLGLGMLDETEVGTIPGAQTAPADSLLADPRGDLSGVDTAMRDQHVTAITDLLNEDLDEYAIADNLRQYVTEYLQGFQELYISVADELTAKRVITKAKLKEFLKLKRKVEDQQ